MPVLQVIIGSTRPGRLGESIGHWYFERAKHRESLEVELVDLAETNLPLMDEPRHPKLGEYLHEHTRRWSETVSRADAFVFVVPEYNFGFNAATKNAIDYLHAEWADKPVGFVSYGGIAGGTRAVQMLKQVVTTLRMIPVFESVNIPFIEELFRTDGEFSPGERLCKAADGMTAEITRWMLASKQVRSGRLAAVNSAPA